MIFIFVRSLAPAKLFLEIEIWDLQMPACKQGRHEDRTSKVALKKICETSTISETYIVNEYSTYVQVYNVPVQYKYSTSTYEYVLYKYCRRVLVRTGTLIK